LVAIWVPCVYFRGLLVKPDDGVVI
jgi:hypothetical protein